MSELLKESNAFLQTMGMQQIVDMFDLLPDALFWVKNTDNQFVYANRSFLDLHALKTLDMLIGKTDYDLSPAYLAKQYATDDEKVKAGQVVTDRLEMNVTKKGDVAWFSTSKRAIIDGDEQVMGTYGVTRHLYKKTAALTSVEAVRIPVDFVRSHYADNITVEQLAEVAHLSVSALERRFKKYLSKTPKQFINEVRLENARQLLMETDKTISQIVFESGFTDHSYFSKQFKILFGDIPSVYRSNQV
ncbi:AraC family transcriptional regulator [Algibacillus agarilyticus]|uniref:AraC family transcriptional regulator n=1 Tax=Algibacillus agarilyticus TaxID=2234133 RepID=UPI000DD091CC|nr:AraC family transcriptional regulator [Algibacillus agarilyticus]